MNPTELIPKLQELVAFYGIKILAAVVIFIVGRWVAKGLKKLMGPQFPRGPLLQTVTGTSGQKS